MKGNAIALPQDESMSPETLQVIFPLSFLGICCLIGEILVQCHRDRSAAAAWPRPMGRTTRRGVRQKARSPANVGLDTAFLANKLVG